MEARTRGLFIIIVALIIVSVSTVAFAAGDELFLTGIVKKVDRFGNVTVDVTTKACSGERQFSIDDVSKAAKKIEQKISFYIDYPSCKAGHVHKMFIPGGSLR